MGVDIETLDRIELNTTVTDDWLSAWERELVDHAPDPLLELSCHWVLKEAYGKALGVGLALPLARLSFVAECDQIVLDDASSRPGGWAFALYRRGTLVIGTAHRPGIRQ